MFSCVLLAAAAVAAALTIQVTDAESQQLVITSDNIIEEVCINEVSQTLHNNKIVHKFDHVPIPDAWNDNADGCITVEATNLNRLSWAGILAYAKSATPTSLYWQCMPMSDVGGPCCTSCTSAPWGKYPPQRLTTYGVNRHHNRDYKSKVPARVTEWFWTKKLKYPHICCKAQTCGSLCKSCKIAGPGLCDPGQCIIGPSGLSPPTLTPTNVCLYRCCVELWNSPTTSGYTITNKATGVVTSSQATNTFFVFWIDITTCSAMNAQSFAANGDAVHAMAGFNLEGSPPTSNKKIPHAIFVQLDSGVSASGRYITVRILDGYGGSLARPISVSGVTITTVGSFTSAKFCYTGYPAADSDPAHDPQFETGAQFN